MLQAAFAGGGWGGRLMSAAQPSNQSEQDLERWFSRAQWPSISNHKIPPLHLTVLCVICKSAWYIQASVARRYSSHFKFFVKFLYVQVKSFKTLVSKLFMTMCQPQIRNYWIPNSFFWMGVPSVSACFKLLLIAIFISLFICKFLSCVPKFRI